MNQSLKKKITAAIAQYREPHLSTDLISAGAVKNIDIVDQTAHIHIELGFPHQSIAAQLQTTLQQQLASIKSLKKATIHISSKIIPHTVQPGLKSLSNIKNIIAIASGKGGVGKSTIAANLALALQAEGAQVGLLDADIYGPSQAYILGAKDRPAMKGPKRLSPVICHGLQTMSIAYLIEHTDTPMVWRGPMVSNALQQLLHQTLWHELDYLVVDLPPGTGDIQLTLAQKIPVSGALIVTTPQELALLDARKALRMFEKVKVPVLGIIENMSVYTCPACGHQAHIFAQDGGEQIAQQYDVDLLGQIPLTTNMRSQAAGDLPIVIAQPQDPITHTFGNIARTVAAKLSLQAKDYTAKFPNIVIENR